MPLISIVFSFDLDLAVCNVRATTIPIVLRGVLPVLSL
jgi:hypothetical protein